MAQRNFADRRSPIAIPEGSLGIIKSVFPWYILDNELNERIAFHGTTISKLDSIAQQGYDSRLSELNGLYGAGTYFAEQSCKSFQYCDIQGEKCIVLTRVTMGHVSPANSNLQGLRLPPT